MTKLRLARTKLSKHLGKRSRLDSPLEQLVQLGRSGGERDERLAILQGVGGSLEIHGYHGFDNLLEFEDFGLRESPDLGKFANGRVGDGFDGVKAGVVQFLDVTGCDAVFLKDLQALVVDGYLGT